MVTRKASIKPKHPSDARLVSLQRSLRQRNLGSYLAVEPNEVRYLSGFGGEDSWLYVPARGKTTLLTDFRFAEDAAADCPKVRAILRKKGLAEELARLRKPDQPPLAFNPDHVTVSLRRSLTRWLGAGALKPLPDAVGHLRLFKDADEIACIQRALDAAETAFQAFLHQVEPGMTEVELAAELEYLMRRHGSEGPAFPTICAVGPAASKPHARPGNRKLGRRDLLLVDFGATFRGYRCDLTRVVITGRIPPEIRRAYLAVLEAQLAAIDAAAPGVLAATVDAAARDILTRHGYGKAFGHGTGHGLGLETHEAPAVSPRAEKTVLQPGMVITIEPGVYLPEQFGIRIEDDVLITGDGCRVLSRLPKDLDSAALALR